jgi:hypothetical protein
LDASGAAAIALWFVVMVPIGVLLGMWGWALNRGPHSRGMGKFLIAWAVIAPLGPPILTLGTWLALGDARPSGETITEAWPYYAGVALYSFGLAIVATPIIAIIAWFWSMARGAEGSS